MATPIEIALRPVAQQVSSYRANREHPRAPFPIELWQKLTKLALVYGTSVVAKQAAVDHTTLAAHVRKLQPEEPEFVECVVTGEAPGFAATVEVKTASGERMRIQASNLKTGDLSQLLREFLGR